MKKAIELRQNNRVILGLGGKVKYESPLHNYIIKKNTNRISNVKTRKIRITLLAKVVFVDSWLQFDVKEHGKSHKYW